jgi:hypothetical protein
LSEGSHWGGYEKWLELPEQGLHHLQDEKERPVEKVMTKESQGRILGRYRNK